MKNRMFLALLLLTVSGWTLHAQLATIKGFVYDAKTGQTIPVASAWIDGTQVGQSTDQHGFFVLQKVPAGQVTLRVSFVGYEDFSELMSVKADEVYQRTVLLVPKVIELGAATISAERQRLQKVNPLSSHRLTPQTLQRIPGLSGQADLAEYLQVIPGVVFTGDRGGQLYIRGGEPVSNLVKLDGMTVVNPFHSVGFASVFDTETIGSVDVYTAGFGSTYGGRISSVIDIRTRTGNRNHFAATASGNTFGYQVIAEGPLKKMTPTNNGSISFMLSQKGSFIKATAPLVYPWLDSSALPFQYHDTYAKISLVGRNGEQIDLSGMRFTDGADYPGLLSSSWTNSGGGARFLMSPRETPLLFEGNLYMTDYRGVLKEHDRRPRNTSYNSVEGAFRVHYNRPSWKLIWGTEMNVLHTVHAFRSTDGTTEEDEFFTTELITFLEARFETRRLLIEPGFRLNYYADRSFISPEPRIRARYKLRDDLQASFAGGWYTQNLVSTTSAEDVVNLFQGFYIGPFFVQNEYKGTPIKNKFQMAWHAVAGVHYFGINNLKINAEVYFKDFTRLINYNRNKIFDEVLWVGSSYGSEIQPYLTKHFIIEKGKAYGIDLLAELNREHGSLYLTYSLGFAHREDEFIQYSPHFDRRHSINLLASRSIGKRDHLLTRIRWNLGSGLPFTQSFGLYEDLSLQDGTFIFDNIHEGDLSVWYGPLNGGRLPWYHRLDVSFSGNWPLGKKASIEATASIMNLYNRRNVFYIDRISGARVDQLPLIPTLGIKIVLN